MLKTIIFHEKTHITWLFRGVNSKFQFFEKSILPHWAVVKTRKNTKNSKFWKKRETLNRNWQIPLIASLQNDKNADFWSFWATFKMPRFSILKLSPCPKTRVFFGGVTILSIWSTHQMSTPDNLVQHYLKTPTHSRDIELWFFWRVVDLQRKSTKPNRARVRL